MSKPRISLAWSLAGLVLVLASCQPQQVTTPPVPSGDAEPQRTATPEPRPTLGPGPLPTAPAPTSTVDVSAWPEMAVADTGIRLRHPPAWQEVEPGLWAGDGGFLSLVVERDPSVAFADLSNRCTLAANTEPERFGTAPVVSRAIPNSPVIGVGCQVHPAADGREGLLLLNDVYGPDPSLLVTLRADQASLVDIAGSLVNAASVPPTSSGHYDSPACAEAPDVPETAWQAANGLMVREAVVADEACGPFVHFDGFRRRLAVAMAELGPRPEHFVSWAEAEVDVAGARLTYAYDDRSARALTGVPSRVNVLRDGVPVPSYAVPELAPNGGPVYGFQVWGSRWVLALDGLLIVDGEIQNVPGQYDDITAWRLLAGEPFFQFRRGTTFGLHLGDEDAPIVYDGLLGGVYCCDYALFETRMTATQVAFLAKRDGYWWYVRVSAPP